MKDNSMIWFVIVLFFLTGIAIGMFTAPNDEITESGLIVRKIRLSSREGIKYYTVTTTKGGNDFEFISKNNYSIGDTLELKVVTKKVATAPKKSTLETEENKITDNHGSD